MQDMTGSDTELINRYLDGSAEALGKLVEKYRIPLYAYLYNMTRGMADADDIFQEVWMRAIRKLAGYREDNFPGWLMRIGHNLVIDRMRRSKPEVSLDDENGEGLSMRDVMPGAGAGADRAAANTETRRKIAEAVAMLPPEQKEVFLLRVEGDMPFKEICRLQGTSINTTLARMQYALAKLRTALQSEYAALGR